LGGQDRGKEGSMRQAMREVGHGLAIGASLLLAGSALAGQGDPLTIARDGVNLRAGPTTSSDVVNQIGTGDKAIELARKGEWYFVELPALQEHGWIHNSLVGEGNAPPAGAAAPSPAPEPPATTAEASPEPDQAEPGLPEVEPQAAAPAPAGLDTGPVAEIPAEPPAASDPAAPAVDATALPPGDEPPAVKTFRDTVMEFNQRAQSVAGIDLFTDVRSAGGGAVQVLATETWADVPEAGRSSYLNVLYDRWQALAGGLGPVSLQIVDSAGQVLMERSGS
jgi:hypothetical protein